MTFTRFLLETNNGFTILAWAAILISLPFFVIGAALLHHWLRPPLPDDFDDPAQWGDQPGPRDAR